jgi:tetratricopeptide (TPR) repeat protein
MKTKLILLTTILAVTVLTNCNQSEQKTGKRTNSLQGKWVRIGHTGPIALEFKKDGTAEIDFGNDQTTDVTTEFEVRNDTVFFNDKKGKMCRETGSYKIYRNNYYIAFDLIEDNCNGRIKSTMGFWTRPDFNMNLKKLDGEILNTEEPLLHLNRARIYMALGKSKQAKSDLDIYLEHNKTDARAYINRAGTRFPDDMEGVLSDCDKAIQLEPTNKNAYFLRGLALYELGEKEEACKNFSKAIELGFSILRIAEYDKCAEYWEKEKNE